MADPSLAERVEELHRRQAAMYAGGPVEPVEELLAEDVVWHVPGESPIAGERVTWSTAGIYRFEGDKVAEAWLVPSNLAAFERIWAKRA